ncbi:hypothetical protein RND81_02G152700 [Saponaria officinalis]|uniref:Endonuclease/exonuclease/phosphatase domain-containing protein n=1 Tax=Saponaria officinalis TaxID=3572 RepID=A0AAW1MMA6_SAPOF
MRRVRSRLEEYNGYEVDCVGRSGGLAVLWKKNLRCTILSATVHYIDMEVREGANIWRLTGFYGWPAIQDRHLSWQQLRILASALQLSWLCLGDFNEILYSTEMKGGTRLQWQMNNFRDAVDECGLQDLPYEGYEFTYDNGQEGEANRQSRLDRAMVSGGWTDLFPYAKLLHLDREGSDHAPIKVLLDGREERVERARKRFRFEQIWVGEDGCEEAVRKAWANDDENLLDSINHCARELQRWKGVSIGKIMRDLQKKRKRLKILNEGGRSAGEVKARRKVVKEIAELLRQEESFWRQRSRALWLKDGDKNTKFFHKKASQRKEKNHIGKLIDEQGRTVTDSRDIATCAVDYFKGLFTSSRPSDFEDLIEGV